MGIYTRKDSPYFWFWLERPGLPALKESSKIPKKGATPQRTKQLRKDAQDAYIVRMADLARARYELPPDESLTADPGITFADFALWYDEHKIPTHRGAERDREILPHLVTFFGRYQLTAIDDPLVTEYETQRTVTDGHKPSTVNREVDLLKLVLAAAVPRHLNASPIAGRRRLRTTKIRKRTLEPSEEPLLLAQLPPRDQVLYIACVDTLVRLGDMLDLRRTDDQGTYLDLLDSKTGPYQVPISTRLRAGLDSLPVGELEGDKAFYFWWRRKAATERDRRGAVRQMLQRACKRAHIPYGRAIAGITWHTGTRASGATRMLRRGVDPATVQAIGNWASLEQMSEYLSTTTPLQQTAVEMVAPDATFAAVQAAAEAEQKARASRKGIRHARKRHVSETGCLGATEGESGGQTRRRAG